MATFTLKENSNKSLVEILDELGYIQLAKSNLGYHAGELDIINNAIKRFKRKNKQYLSFLGLEVINDKIVSKGISGIIPLEFAINKGDTASLIVDPMIHWNILSDFAAVTKHRDWLKINVEWETPNTLNIELWYFSLPFLKEAMYVLERPAKGYKKIAIENDFPMGQTNWEDFSINKYPYKRLRFNNTTSKITLDTLPHQLIKWGINAIEESIQSPSKVPLEILELIDLLKFKLKNVSEKIPNERNLALLPRSGAWGGYQNLYQELRNIASIAGIVKDKNKIGRAYAIETEKLFEHFVVYLLERYSRENNLRFYSDINNSSRIGFEQIAPNYYVSMLSSLKPDAVITDRDLLLVVDAKYKRHFDLLQHKNRKDENWFRNEFRNDIHQILSYSIFSNKKNKILLLAYPSFKANANINIWKLFRNSHILLGLIPILLKDYISLELIYQEFRNNVKKAIRYLGEHI